ncbi:MAG: squalene/phytoene synthase family protein [Devosiaceae bacterium]|nr:squalene/phytoene synthase family protein [Devosiaceae bacterium]
MTDKTTPIQKSGQKTTNGQYISQFLKQHDSNRYYSTLVLDEISRNDVQSLYAFAVEISRIRSMITEPAPGEIRLQYWVDLLSGSGHGDTSQNPVASSLLATINRHDLPVGALLRMLEARRFDLYDDPMPDMASFEGYAGETNSMLYQLATIIVNKGEDAGAATAAGHMGVAHALIGHMLGIGKTLSRGQIFLPLSIFSAHGVKQNQLLAKQTTPEIIAAFASLRETAGLHLTKAQEAITSLRPELRPVFALHPVLNWQLQRLNTGGKKPFSPPVDMAPWLKIARLLWWSLRN